MQDLTSQYAVAKKLALSCENELARLEAAEKNGGSGAPPSSILKRAFSDLERAAHSLESTYKMHLVSESNPRSRTAWKNKVQSISEKVDSLRTYMQHLEAVQRRRMNSDAQRAELFRRGADGAAAAQEMQTNATVNRSMQNSKRALEEAYETGMNVLGHMAGTQDRLKGIQRKMLDVTSTLHLGDFLLKVAGRRQTRDALIGCGMMVGLVGLLVFMIWMKFG